MKLCDHQSVGVVVIDPDPDRLLLLTRAKPPKGKAPIAGHIDEHGTPGQAAQAEAFEEAGLRIAGLSGPGLRSPALQVQLPNVCRRPPSHTKHDGHFWNVYEVELTEVPETVFSADETHGGGWYTTDEVAALAGQTIRAISAGTGDIGLEPVWVDLLSRLGHLLISGNEAALVRDFYSRPPA